MANRKKRELFKSKMLGGIKQRQNFQLGLGNTFPFPLTTILPLYYWHLLDLVTVHNSHTQEEKNPFLFKFFVNMIF